MLKRERRVEAMKVQFYTINWFRIPQIFVGRLPEINLQTCVNCSSQTTIFSIICSGCGDDPQDLNMINTRKRLLAELLQGEVLPVDSLNVLIKNAESDFMPDDAALMK
jgi:hypothetical protein